MPEQVIKLAFYEGTNLSFECPSGDKYTIREQTLDDDETISKMDIRTGDESERIRNLNDFIRSIVIEGPKGKGTLAEEDVLTMKLKDKYFILLKTRIHSIGPGLKFTTECRNERCAKELKFNEDLNQYDNTFKEGSDNGFKYQVKPYVIKGSATDEFAISNGMKFRYKFMDGRSELAMISLARNGTVSDNSQLYIRNLEAWTDNKWQTVSMLNFISKRHGIEVKARIENNDAQDILAMECKCPHCQTEWLLPFNSVKAFFFPTEI